MIKIEKTEVVGWEAAIRGMRNPKNSHHLSDSMVSYDYTSFDRFDERYQNIEIGPNDRKLMMSLAKGGPVHAKYRRYIDVYCDITAPLYWWKEFETYRNVVADNPFDIEFNSCSTMHKIADKEFTLDDFSHEHLISDDDSRMDNFESLYYDDAEDGDASRMYTGPYFNSPLSDLEYTIQKLNLCRRLYLDKSIGEKHRKVYWWQMIQLLPSSYNQKRTVKMNYEVLAGMWTWRKDHKQDEWKEHKGEDIPFANGLCDWIKTLPYSEIITLEETSE